MITIIAIATAFTLILWWILDLVRTDEKAIRIKFGQLGRKGRKLGLYEEFLWTAQNQIGLGVNVNAVFFESSKDVTESHVRHAINALWRRHPLLRCSIITISKGPLTMNYFTEIAGKPNCDLKMVPSVDWREVFDEELNNGFLTSGPQWRVKVILPRRENERYVIPFIFSFNSCIVDGTSLKEGVFKDFQKYLSKAVYPETAMPVSVDDSATATSGANDETDTSFSDMSSSLMASSFSSAMSNSTRDIMNISEYSSDSIMEISKQSADDTLNSTRDVTRAKSDEKVMRLLPAQENLYKDLKPRFFERLLLPLVNKLYHKPFLSVDPLSVTIQTHLKPKTPVRKTGVFTFLLDEKETEIFRQECCSRRVSITSAVLAAAAISLQDILRTKAFHGNVPMKLNSLIMCDMREGSEVDVPRNTIGNHEGMVDVNITLPKSNQLTQNIWKTAQSLHNNLKRKLHSSHVYSWSRWLHRLLRRKDGVKTFMTSVSKRPSNKSYIFTIRNRGESEEADEVEEKEQCRITASYFTSAEHMVGLAMFSLGLVIIQGRLYVTIGYDRHVVDYVIADEFTELLREHLVKDTETQKETNSIPGRKPWRFWFLPLPILYPTSP